ncbi:MAG: hypothetical protein KatS3mg011_1449 [Acidimicrobiia bacterium]|nr:MAG: hypothetical protein KatS3mg011_1449 [Acidimicrobiia bacterium]
MADELVEAERRYQMILRLSEEGRMAQLSDLLRDGTTVRMLGLLPEASRRRVEVHLREVAAWEQHQRDLALRRLFDARRALERFDLDLAKGLAAKVDSRWLDPRELEERDQLLIDISARELELEPLQRAERALTEKPRPGRRPWWRRLLG